MFRKRGISLRGIKKLSSQSLMQALIFSISTKIKNWERRGEFLGGFDTPEKRNYLTFVDEQSILQTQYLWGFEEQLRKMGLVVHFISPYLLWGRIWQRRYWEHMIRDEDDFSAHFDYTHYNLVKHGLANAPKDWPYSTFHRYVKKGLYSRDWGTTPIACP